MNFIEDEPRKVPKPVPFSQNSPLHPTVPEVSLILQETARSPSPARNSSFAGTEFQTYNAWRWKNINEKEKENLTQRFHVQNKRQEFYPINDKFSGSDIERRKNEILYGNSDEPRRPLPPMVVPVIPNCTQASFTDASFDNEPWVTDENKDYVNFSKGVGCFSANNNNFTKYNKQWIQKPDAKSTENLNDIRDLYKIISEQNKQMAFLQRQIEQLLGSQSSKEKQIEQLLMSQETKENKIEQLLKIQDVKESHIEQLLKVQEKHEKQIEQLIHSQEIREQQNNELSKKIKSLSKEVTTVGTMTETDVAERSTNTSFNCCCKQMSAEALTERVTTAEEGPIDCSRLGTGDKSFTLNSLQLPLVQEHIPTPQSSIHVDIPDYNGSSDEETDLSSSTSKEVNVQCMSDSKPLGYTFYNNVLTQVKDIIESHEDKENSEPIKSTVNREKLRPDSEKSNLRKCTLRENEMQKINPSISGKNSIEKFWGMDFYEETHTDFRPDTKMFGSPKGGIDTSMQAKFDCNLTKETQSPSDISMKMNALALKYLKEEQISEYQIESQLQSAGRQPDVTIYNVTNLSFGTMRYLERYRISSGEPGRQNEMFHSPHHFLQHKAKAAFRGGSTKNFEHM